MRLLCKQAQIDTQNIYLFSSLLEFFNRLKERILAKKKDSGKLKECKARVRHRERDQGRLNKLFVCPSVVHPGLALCLASRVISLHNDHCRSCISIFTAVSVAFKGVLCLVACSSTGLIMQGMGKTERGEQGRDIDLTSLRSTMPASGPLQGGSASNLNMNLYATKKTAAEGMLDIALFLANITHMKTVIEQGAGYRYYAAVLTLISFSLALQIVAGILIIIIARRDLNEEANQKRLDSLNNTLTITIFLVFVTNIFITVFGMERTGLFARMHF
uniref:Ninjurin 2 n=3 Tax=Haplochromini TaxID=319058 RepID=A0A3Q2WG55_HAPBU